MDEYLLDEEDHAMYDNEMSEEDKALTERNLKRLARKIATVVIPDDLDLAEYIELFEWTGAWLVWKTFPEYKQKIEKGLHKNQSLMTCRDEVLIDCFYSINNWDFAKVIFNEFILARLHNSKELQIYFGFKLDNIQEELIILSKKAKYIRTYKTFKPFIARLIEAFASPCLFDYKQEVYAIESALLNNNYVRQVNELIEPAELSLLLQSNNRLTKEFLKLVNHKDNTKYKQLLRLGFNSKLIKKYHNERLQYFADKIEWANHNVLPYLFNLIIQYNYINLDIFAEELESIRKKLEYYAQLSAFRRILYVYDDKFTNEDLRAALLMKPKKQS